MHIRGRFLVGDRPFSYGFVRRFLTRASELGIAVVRLLDPVNNLQSLAKVGKMAQQAGLNVQCAILCSGNCENFGYYRSLLNHADLSDFDSVGIFDPWGTLRAGTVGKLTDLLIPLSEDSIFVHLHSLEGGGVHTVAKALEKGATIVDTCFSAFTSDGSLPSLEVISRALEADESVRRLNLRALVGVSRGLWRVRKEYLDRIPSIMRPETRFEKSMEGMRPTSSYLMAQKTGGKSNREYDIQTEADAVVRELGLIALVAPLTEIVARQIILNLRSKNRYDYLTDEFLRLLRGEFGSVKLAGELARYLNVRVRETGKAGREQLEERVAKPLNSGGIGDEGLLNFEIFPQEYVQLLDVKRRSYGGKRQEIVAATLAILAEAELSKPFSKQEQIGIKVVSWSKRWRDSSRPTELSSLRQGAFIEEPF